MPEIHLEAQEKDKTEGQRDKVSGYRMAGADACSPLPLIDHPGFEPSLGIFLVDTFGKPPPEYLKVNDQPFGGKMKAMKCLIIGLIFAFGVLSVWAQPQEVIWNIQEEFQIDAIDANASGDVVIAGITYRSLYDYYIYKIKKYNSNGELQWSKEIADFQWAGGGFSPFDLNELKVNDDGEVFFYNIQNMVYVTNNYTSEIAPSGPILLSGITKLSSTGEFLWNSSLTTNYPGGIRIDFADDRTIVTGQMTKCSSIIPLPNLPTNGSPTYQVVAVLDDYGQLQSYNHIYSDWDCIIEETYVQGNSVYIVGYFGYYTTHTPPAFLCFQHSINGDTVLSYIYENDGSYFIAKFDFASTTWLWESNLNYSQGWGYNFFTICEAYGQLFWVPDVNYCQDIYKINSDTG